MENPEFRKEVGLKIRKARKKAKLTQTQLALQIDMSSNHLAMIERGEINTTIDALKKIADALKIDVSFLVKIKK